MKGFAIALALLGGTLHASESVTSKAGVATSSRYATQAAITTLRGGGSAMDAAIAAAFVLSVARPDAAGIGGGGFLVYYDKTENATWAVDFREMAPWTPEEAKNTDPAATPPDTLPNRLATVGTPGVIRGLTEAHERFGRSSWSDLLQPAVLLAKEGFAVDTVLGNALYKAIEAKTLDDTTRGVLLADAKAGALPNRIVQPDLSATLARLAKSPDDLYTGTLATKVLESTTPSGGRLTIRDFREYRPVWRAPLRIGLGDWSIQTAPPPSRGGVAMASMLAILGSYDFAGAKPGTPGMLHLLAEAERRATFDAKRVVADPAYSRLAIGSILGVERADFWKGTIVPDRATSTPAIVAASATPKHTTHVSVIDAAGNVASLTLSLSGDFGSGVMVPGTGILLNGALQDFTTSPSPHPNAPEPRKRPATPVAPLILFKGDTPVLAAGSSGGEAIPGCLTALVIQLTKQSRTLREAIDEPRIHQPDYPDRVSWEPGLEASAARLSEMGHQVLAVPSICEINAVRKDGDRVVSIADPRGKGSSGGY